MPEYDDEAVHSGADTRPPKICKTDGCSHSCYSAGYCFACWYRFTPKVGDAFTWNPAAGPPQTFFDFELLHGVVDNIDLEHISLAFPDVKKYAHGAPYVKRFPIDTFFDLWEKQA